MFTVWKFELEITDEQTVRMPKGARLLSVALGRFRPRPVYGEPSRPSKIWLWAAVDTTNSLGEPAPEVDRTIFITGTGNPCPMSMLERGEIPFIGTVVDPIGLVWHVWNGGAA